MYCETEVKKNKHGQDVFRLKIVENVRVNGKPRKKFIRSVGTAKNEDELKLLKKLAVQLIDQEIRARNGGDTLFDTTDVLQEYEEELNVDYRKLREEKRLTEGNREVFTHLFEESGFSSVLEGKQAEILREVIVARIDEPSSKRKSQELLEKKFGFKTSLDSIYRMMSALEKRREFVLSQTLNGAKNLFNNKIDIVFFDVTTLYFESTIEDELRQFGFSKDQKFQQTQVVLALAVTNCGLPIAYKLFPGNTAETGTLIACLNEWKNFVDIGRIVFVADRGMFQAANLKMLENSGYEFIVAATLRRMNKSIQEQILDKESYRPLTSDESFSIKTLEHALTFKDAHKKEQTVKGRLIVTRSSLRAAKDKKDRERLLAKMNKVLGKDKSDAAKLISNKGYLKYAKFEGKKLTSIDNAKVLADERWDGIHGIFTNADLSDDEVLKKYKELWLVEESFRISKNDLDMRPIYHFKKERIEAHILICFMSLYMLRKAQILLERAGIHISPDKLREELSSVQSSIVYDKSRGIKFRMPSHLSDLAKSIYKALGLNRSMRVSRVR